MAHKKGEGSTQNGRDSHGQRRGVKIYGGQQAEPGNIIVRQRGTQFWPGKGVMMGKDYTIFAVTSGKVEFKTRAKERQFINIVPVATEAAN
ncbi:MAG: 50S ribosomal protein L27 [Bacteroidota bacterium]